MRWDRAKEGLGNQPFQLISYVMFIHGRFNERFNDVGAGSGVVAAGKIGGDFRCGYIRAVTAENARIDRKADG